MPPLNKRCSFITHPRLSILEIVKLAQCCELLQILIWILEVLTQSSPGIEYDIKDQLLDPHKEGIEDKALVVDLVLFLRFHSRVVLQNA